MNVKKNFLFHSFNQILLIIIPTITVPYVSRTLGAENIGTYSYIYSIAYYFVMITMLGLNNYGNREIARVKNNRKLLNRTFSSIYIMQLIIGSIMFIIFINYALFFAKNNRTVFLLMSLQIFAAIIDINWLMYGLEEFAVTSVRNSVVEILILLCFFAFVKNDGNLIAYTCILCLGAVLSQISVWPYAMRRVKFVRVEKKELIHHLKPNIVLFIPVVAVSLYKIMDKVMLGYLSDMTQVGFYESSEKIIKIPLVLITSLGTVMLPHMANIFSDDEYATEKVKRYIEKSLIFAMLLSSSMSFGIMAVSKEFVPLFYGKGFETCIILFQILLPSCLFLAFSNVIRTQYLIPCKRDHIFIKSVFAGAIVNWFVNIMLIPEYGSIGAAVGTLFAEFAVCSYQAFLIGKELPVKKYAATSIRLVFPAVIMYFIICRINLASDSLLLNLIIKVVTGVCVYIISFWILNRKICSEILDLMVSKMKHGSGL